MRANSRRRSRSSAAAAARRRRESEEVTPVPVGDEATIWWSANRPAAPGAIHEERTRAFSLLAAQPRIGALVRSTRLEGVRRIHLSRVRHHVYRRATPTAVEVLAFWHPSRGRGPDL